MQKIIFEKYSASGNDFLITHCGFTNDVDDALCDHFDLSFLARLLCHRFEGIGADGLVVVSPHEQYDYQWKFYNSDGSEASMCGNASRCVGLYSFLHSFAPRVHHFLSGAGKIGIEILNQTYPYRVKSVLGEYKYLGSFGEWNLFDTGVPHLVKLTSKEEYENLSLEDMRVLRKQYDANVNIAFCENETFVIKTYERGVEGITLACGTGMASLVALLHYFHGQDQDFLMIPPSKEVLKFYIEGKVISFEGEVKKIAECEVNLNDFGVEI
ncbi:diaminopimelate epimerase [Helicobacter kayseriensis]|uniref:diaminopimelate epimerase n=1 Tax=Helicobacter kayseriensis TaxID=2905877 RepID=UPI001E614478|nr:diaminopimelate epimerase [Helicobacter kayseriensis]MCE3046628.1 diaminopimelate epimerase [Helicobacter kayseriensis]MCE3048070.1 diaminopimelate epimerase [Helicobacter kayseriensis]